MKKKPKEKKNSANLNDWEIVNKRKNKNYLLFKTWEAGIILKGKEVKKILSGEIDFKNSYVTYDKKNEIYLTNLKISDKEKTSDKQEKHKLLMHKSQIKDLIKQKTEKKYTIIPTRIYLKNKKIKVAIALAKGLKKYEKKRHKKHEKKF